MKNRTSSCLIAAVFCVTLANAMSVWGQTGKQVRILQTDSGIRFGLLGEKGPTPAPTLFVFAMGIEETLGDDDYVKVGRILGKEGYITFSLDLPCHGPDVRPGETANSMSGWRSRLEKGEDFVADFVPKASAVLDYLIREGYTDPHQVAASGTSRGGFIALQFAAAEPRVKSVAAFVPVTNLLALSEFVGMEREQSPAGKAAFRKARTLALINVADKLTGRPIWICIGNDDRRVGTDNAIGFSRRLVEAAYAQNEWAAVDLHVTATEGHRVYDTAHEDAAAWILAQMKESQ